MLRPCLGVPGESCGQLGQAARCERHAKAWKALRNADRSIAAAVVAASPVCVDCGATVDLEADHVVPLIRSGRNDGPRATRCQPCNRDKGIS